MKRNSLLLLAFLIACIAIRLWFWTATDLTLEDSLISFRYSRNIAAGNGFVYNHGEKVLGTSTPLWTLLLAGTNASGITDTVFTAKTLGILFDCCALILLFGVFQETCTRFAAILWAALVIGSPEIVPVTVSGMETSLVLSGMALMFFGLTRKNIAFPIGATIVLLTRIDGLMYVAILAVAAVRRDRLWAVRQMLSCAALCAPWFLFSFFYFGDIVPQSLRAKLGVYNLDIGSSSRQFLSLFTPLGESRPLTILWKSVVSILMLSGFTIILRRYRSLLPLSVFFIAYCCAFMFSGTVIFRWYLVPAVFVGYIILAAGAEWILTSVIPASMRGVRWTAMIPVAGGAILVLANLLILVHREDRFAQLQGLEDGLRRNIGLWLHDHARENQSVFLEPTGYIGYYAGTQIRILDEVGLVTPEVVGMRRLGSGWYTPAVRALNPDYIVQYTYNLEHNCTEGSGIALFANEDDRRWFFATYREIKRFDLTGSFPLIDNKEKSYVLLKHVGL